MYVNECIYVQVYIYIYIYIQTYIHTFIRSYIHIYMQLSLSLSLFLSLFKDLPTHLPTQLSVYLSICLSVCVYVWTYICMSIHIYIYVYMLDCCRCIRSRIQLKWQQRAQPLCPNHWPPSAQGASWAWPPLELRLGSRTSLHPACWLRVPPSHAPKSALNPKPWIWGLKLSLWGFLYEASGCRFRDSGSCGLEPRV